MFLYLCSKLFDITYTEKDLSEALTYIKDRPMLRVVIMMIAGIAVGRILCTPFGVRGSFAVLLCLMALTVMVRRWEIPSTIAVISVNFAFGFFLITNSDHNGQVATIPLPGIEQVEETLGEAREHLANVYHQHGLSGDEYAVVNAMTLGNKSEVTPELRDTYNKSGAAHVFAVSGLHLGIIWGLLVLMLPTRAFPRFSGIVMLMVIWMYAFLVGLHASVVRATVMLTCYTLCKMLARETDSMSILTFTAFLLLVYNPQWLFDVGFQMSFLATLSILLFASRMMRMLSQHTEGVSKKNVMMVKIGQFLWGIASVSILGQLAVAPLIAYYFGRFSTYFMLSSFIVSPGAFIIIILAILMCIFSLPLICLLNIVWIPAWCLLHVVKFMNSSLEWIISLPYSTIDGIHLSILQVGIIYLLIGCGMFLLFKVLVVFRMRP